MPPGDFNSSPMQQLVGAKINEVSLVLDYLQLGFEGPSLTLYHWPDLIASSVSVSRDMAGYLDLLSQQIGSTVERVELDEQVALTVTLSTGVTLRTSLADEAYSSSEAVVFSTGIQGKTLVVF